MGVNSTAPEAAGVLHGRKIGRLRRDVPQTPEASLQTNQTRQESLIHTVQSLLRRVIYSTYIKPGVEIFQSATHLEKLTLLGRKN